MTTKPDDYNAKQLAAGALTPTHISALVAHWQRSKGLTVDGMAGPVTLRSILPDDDRPATSDDLQIADGWLIGYDVTSAPAHSTWYGGLLSGAKPGGVVAHYSATAAGTAAAMAKRRMVSFATAAAQDPELKKRGPTSWHASIETNGAIVQMVPFTNVAHHAGGTTARHIPGLGHANYTAAGIELIGFGDKFPDAQVRAACRVWRALVRYYAIPRALAMISHQSIDPTRREDPGPVWMTQHAENVLRFAFA
jgi:hypothetical protein